MKIIPFLLLSSVAALAPPLYAPKRTHDISIHATKNNNHRVSALMTGAASLTSQLLFIESARAASDLEVADLPPPYVPVAFGIALLGGVGWLTSSLGDVMSDEASLGFQSGARAKKEMERSRSSYFKKK